MSGVDPGPVTPCQNPAMAYTLQAFVAPTGGFPSTLPGGLRIVALRGALEMIPLDTAARRHHELPFLPLTDEGAAEPPKSIEALAGSLGRQSRLIYVEAEFFGGAGGQASLLFSAGRRTGRAHSGGEAINAALRWLGVEPKDEEDEFEAAGLGARVDTDDW